jgi:hypothetical protein
MSFRKLLLQRPFWALFRVSLSHKGFSNGRCAKRNGIHQVEIGFCLVMEQISAAALCI